MKSVEFLKSFLNRIDTQDNLCTAKPIQFLLQTPYNIVVDGDYSYDKIQYYHSVMENGAVDSKEEAIKYLKDYGFKDEELEEEIGNIEKLCLLEVWKTEQAFLTREGADRHIAMNRHNYRKGHRVYVVHAFRDPELKELYEAIRDVVSQHQANQEAQVPHDLKQHNS